jgi:hypothetical protein
MLGLYEVKNVVADLGPRAQARQDNSRMRQDRAKTTKLISELEKSGPPTSAQDQQIKALEKELQEVRHAT